MGDSEDDSRVTCKYGLECYQRNPEHHKKYKHPKRKSDEQISNAEKRNKVHKSPEKDASEEKKSCRTDSSETLCGSNKVNEKRKTLELPSDIPMRIEAVYLVKMPDDFFSFFQFCKSVDKKSPHEALLAADLKLVGPYDLIDRDLKEFTQEEGLRHFRYYYDPPEFQTILSCSNKELLHYGYFRDNPNDLPSFVGSNEANSGCTIDIVSKNVFSALNHHLEKMKKVTDPFKKMKLHKIQQSLINWSTKNNFDLETYAKTNRERKSKMVTKTFHGAGIVVPYEKKTELGYRKLKENNEDLKKILKQLTSSDNEEEKNACWAKLQSVITYASIANDECDFGTSLELGIDLFCFGDPILHKTILNVLPTSYDLLGRSDFTTVLKAHLKNRTKGSQLNTIVQ